MKDYKSDTVVDVPERLSESDTIYFLRKNNIDGKFLSNFKISTGLSLEVLSEWLHVTPKTLRNYLSRDSGFEGPVGEQVLLLASLFKHGSSVFGSYKSFEFWLNSANHMLNGIKPAEMLSSVSGIRLIDDRLTGIEYGDNA